MGELPEAKQQPNGSNGVLHIPKPCSPNSSTSSLTATTHEAPSASQNLTIIPRNFVWRLQGGRRASSSTNSTEPDQEDTMAAADVVANGPVNGVLRGSFDPWNRHNHRSERGGKGSVNGHVDEDDEVCKGCIKISKTRASTALRDRKRAGSHGELVIYLHVFCPRRRAYPMIYRLLPSPYPLPVQIDEPKPNKSSRPPRPAVEALLYICYPFPAPVKHADGLSSVASNIPRRGIPFLLFVIGTSCYPVPRSRLH